MKIQQKSGFSLIELLVVIAIIGILAGVLLSQFTGATDSARATQCLTNMRNLAVAVQNVAMNSSNGDYPAASSFKYSTVRNGALEYHVKKGWISWNLRNDNAKSKSGGSVVPFNATDVEQLRFAITNGLVWAAAGQSYKAYQCPVHAAACLKANGNNPGWSYVMNQEFGYNPDPAKPRRWTGQQHSSFKTSDGITDPGKVLLFAELQGLTIADDKAGVNITPNLSASGTEADCMLEYAKNEAIGFNHKMSNGKYVAHVAFADGHVEKLIHPSSGLSIAEITKKLCQGHELSFNGRSYEDANN